jgi:NADPH-dependent 2,4-dienoyl-CoA reductase/sulfur reductase-like enzyme
MTRNKPMLKLKFNHRDALKLLGDSVAAALAPGQSLAGDVSQNPASQTEVVVVGAGFAGMMAARSLIRSG